MGILDQIRNTTVADLDRVTGDFSDLPASTYRPRVEREMIRVVKGATDLRDSNPHAGIPSAFAGQVTVDPSMQRRDSRLFKGEPTPGQRNFITSLMMELSELDRDAWSQGIEYMTKMNAAGAWNPARGENVSRWIDRLKAKIAELKAAVPAVDVHDGPDTYPVIRNDFPNLPDGRYAVNDSGDWKFYRISTGKKGGAYEGRRFVKVQASDTEHPIRNAATRKAIMTSIESMGWKESTAAYGHHIGACGRCGRTLTDADSRARGIGPDCWGKM
jgi:hypothetical protein